MTRPMCHHHELIDWEAIREEIAEREQEDRPEAEEPAAPTADD